MLAIERGFYSQLSNLRLTFKNNQKMIIQHPKMLSTYPTLLRQQLWQKVAKLLRQDAFGCTAKKVSSALTLTRLSCLIPTRFRTRITTVCNRVVSSWRRRLSYVPTPLGCKVRPSVSWIMKFF